MPKYKVLKSVAHNFGHSFISLENFSINDYILGHIVKTARICGESNLELDILLKKWLPSKLVTPIVAERLLSYCVRFQELVTSAGSSIELVKTAKMNLFIDLEKERIVERYPIYTENYFECKVEIIDIRGKIYLAEFKDWWYPET